VNASGDVALQAIDAQLAAMTQRAERTERELNSTSRELKTLRVQTAELETRCSSLDGLLRGKDASLTERARRIEDLQDQLQRLETRVDERNAQITELKRLRDEPPPSAYAAARNTAPAYTSHPKPQ
jgi:chromosome segregation ATPase